NANDDDDGIPRLSSETLAALTEFFAEQANQQKENIEENWQLSQFWYSKETAEKLAAECVSAVNDGGRIACISCPTLVEYLLRDEAIVL
ncbi:N(6)-adenine-specific DNA methyltransferase 2, partial [Toxocara canis]